MRQPCEVVMTNAEGTNIRFGKNAIRPTKFPLATTQIIRKPRLPEKLVVAIVPQDWTNQQRLQAFCELSAWVVDYARIGVQQ